MWETVFRQSPKNPPQVPRTPWYLIWRTYKRAAKNGRTQSIWLSHSKACSPAVRSRDGCAPCQQPICKYCGEQLIAVLETTCMEKIPLLLAFFNGLIAPGHRCQASSLHPPLQLHKESLHHVLQVTPWSENACLKASVPSSIESQIHYQCRTDLFGVAKKWVR